MTAEGPVCSVAPFLLAVLISPLILLRPTHMTHYSQIPTLNQLASYASSGEFLTLMTPSEVTLQNALLSVIFNICERGHLAQSDLASLMDAWDGLSHHLELPPPGGSEGGAGATANNGEGSGDGNGDTTANNGEANKQGNGDGNEGEGGNTGEGGNEGENEAGGDDMDVDTRPPLDGDAAAASSSGQNGLSPLRRTGQADYDPPRSSLRTLSSVLGRAPREDPRESRKPCPRILSKTPRRTLTMPMLISPSTSTSQPSTTCRRPLRFPPPPLPTHQVKQKR